MEATPVDEYMARELAFKYRIEECKRSIKFWMTRTGLARFKAKNKIKGLRKAISQLEVLKEMDCLPWEPGPTMDMDALSTSMLADL